MVMSKQLLRCGTSIGANTRESKNAQSRMDFLNKLNIALKEADETEYWLDLLHFYEISYGSLMESYCQLILASDLKYIGTADLDQLRPQIDTVARMLNGLRSSLLKTVNGKQ